MTAFVPPYPNWRPYCLRCPTMERMQEFGRHWWKCQHCGAEHYLDAADRHRLTERMDVAP